MFTDPVGDMIARIRNAQMRSKKDVIVPASRFKSAVLNVLVAEGYLEKFDMFEEGGNKHFRVFLKYFNQKPVIQEIRRVSKPSVRRYTKCRKMIPFANGLGTTILSTSLGVFSDREAKERNVGGKILLTVR